MRRRHQNASVVAALVMGAAVALALSSASMAMWLGAGAAVGLVLAAALNNVVADRPTAGSEQPKAKNGF